MRIVYIVADRGIPVMGTKGASIHIQQIVRGFTSGVSDVFSKATERNALW